MSPPLAPGRVLPTLDADGKRLRVHPRLYTGRTWRARRIVAYALMAIFLSLPFINVGGKPALLLDVARREFTAAGHTYYATDGVVLMLVLLSAFVGVIWLTALVGRGFCGWACPQTVYMEFLFRPLERLFEGRREDQLRLDKQGGSLRRTQKNIVYFLIAFVLANVFLCYFVGWTTLASWMLRSPLEHYGPFLLVAATTALVFFDFAYFREQMCTVACPYARLQSVLLDRQSLLVGYDTKRGEPREKGKPKPGRGDCIDCNACVVACPTGIDIRNGLQLECIACAQCMDACDSIMARIGKPLGLVRYASQDAFEHNRPSKIARPRVWFYSLVFAGCLVALAYVSAAQAPADVTILRGIGAPYAWVDDQVTNQVRIKIRNRGSRAHVYQVELRNAPDAQIIAPEWPLRVPAGAQASASMFVRLPRSAFQHGERRVVFQVSDDGIFISDSAYVLLGPTANPAIRGNP